jgi:pimeloyl-ACP methyl ester carboxylesterase
MARIPPDQLEKIAVPVALVWARNDRIINDCGHFLIGERPDAFLEALRAAMGTPE